MNSQFNYLEHYGVLGMKWGVRRTPEELGHKRLQKAKTSNVAKWGKTPKTNVLYVTGYSGSGKTTAAKSFLSSKDSLIYLDAYAESLSTKDKEYLQDKNFNKYLDTHLPLWRELGKNTSSKLPMYSKQYWKTVDDFAKVIESYGSEQYKQGKKVIVEGAQIASGWLNHDYSFYSEKPIVVLSTGRITSMRNAYKRDNRGTIINVLIDDFANNNSQWSESMQHKIDELTKMSGSKRDERLMRAILQQYGNRTVKA